MSEIAKTKEPWRPCKCEVKNDDFNFFESRQPYVASHRTKLPAATIDESGKMKFRILENIDDTLKSITDAIEDQSSTINSLLKPTLCGSKNVAPTNPNRRCANLRLELSVSFKVGWGSASGSVTTFCEAMEKAHAKFETTLAASSFLFIGSVDPRFREENTENIVWDMILGGSIVEAPQNLTSGSLSVMAKIKNAIPELLMSFKPPGLPLLFELIHRKTKWFKSGREMNPGQYLIITFDVPGMKVCPCLIPPKEWLEKIGELVVSILQLIGPYILAVLKEVGKAIAKQLLEFLKNIDWSSMSDAAQWAAANVGWKSTKFVRLEMTISPGEGISLGVGCLRNKILTIKTPYVERDFVSFAIF